ncbi:hypothetical protein D3C87_1822590 [compost metagenome]
MAHVIAFGIDVSARVERVVTAPIAHIIPSRITRHEGKTRHSKRCHIDVIAKLKRALVWLGESRELNCIC